MKLISYQLGKKYARMQKSFQVILLASLRLRQSGWANFIQERAGFTLFEVILVVAIVAFISAQILVSFSGLNQASILKRSAQELSFNIRRAQNMALAVAPVNIGGSLTIPQSVGIRLTTSTGDTDSPGPDGIPDNGEYFFFSDENGNGSYNGVPNERIEPQIILPGGMRIIAITGISGFPSAHILFYTPEARVLLSRHNGNSVGNFMDVTLAAPSGDTITVRIRISGQVSVL